MSTNINWLKRVTENGGYCRCSTFRRYDARPRRNRVMLAGGKPSNTVLCDGKKLYCAFCEAVVAIVR